MTKNADNYDINGNACYVFPWYVLSIMRVLENYYLRFSKHLTAHYFLAVMMQHFKMHCSGFSGDL